jgi:hypothetical protein
MNSIETIEQVKLKDRKKSNYFLGANPDSGKGVKNRLKGRFVLAGNCVSSGSANQILCRISPFGHLSSLDTAV